MLASRKALLFGLLLLVAGLGVAGIVYRSTSTPDLTDHSQKLFIPDMAKVGGTGINLTAESTGERWRKVQHSADGTQVVSAEVGYQDNRRGVFYFDGQGKAKGYQAYAAEDNQRLVYEADFDPATGMIIRSRTLNAEGNLESEFRLLADGAEQTSFYG